MTGSIHQPQPQDRFEYHGHTMVEHTRTCFGKTVLHEWLLFDTVTEAVEFFCTALADTPWEQ